LENEEDGKTNKYIGEDKMKFYKCDKCGKELTVGEYLTIYIKVDASHSKNDLDCEVDLCSNCEKDILNYLRPISLGLINKEKIK